MSPNGMAPRLGRGITGFRLPPFRLKKMVDCTLGCNSHGLCVNRWVLFFKYWGKLLTVTSQRREIRTLFPHSESR
jgi:hypothetical protein